MVKCVCNWRGPGGEARIGRGLELLWTGVVGNCCIANGWAGFGCTLEEVGMPGGGFGSLAEMFVE